MWNILEVHLTNLQIWIFLLLEQYENIDAFNARQRLISGLRGTCIFAQFQNGTMGDKTLFHSRIFFLARVSSYSCHAVSGSRTFPKVWIAEPVGNPFKGRRRRAEDFPGPGSTTAWCIALTPGRLKGVNMTCLWMMMSGSRAGHLRTCALFGCASRCFI